MQSLSTRSACRNPSRPPSRAAASPSPSRSRQPSWRRAGRPGRRRAVADGLGQDPRLRASRSSSGPTGKTRTPERARARRRPASSPQQVAGEIDGHRPHARHARGHRRRRRGHRQARARRRRAAHIVVATPGRLEDLIARRLVRLDDVLDARARRGRPHARRRLPAGRRAHRRARSRAPARRWSSRPRSTAPVGELAAELHAQPRARSRPRRETEAAPRRAPLPDRREGRQARRARRAAAATSASWRWSSCARSTAPAGWPSASSAAACAPPPCTAT